MSPSMYTPLRSAVISLICPRQYLDEAERVFLLLCLLSDNVQHGLEPV